MAKPGRMRIKRNNPTQRETKKFLRENPFIVREKITQRTYNRNPR